MMKNSQKIKEILVGLAADDKLPLDMNELDESLFAFADIDKEADGKEPLSVKRWLRTGELSEHLKSQAEIIEECGRALDKACAYEIVGEAIFEATNGKYYVITTEALIDECNPQYIKDLLEEIKVEEGEEDE